MHRASRGDDIRPERTARVVFAVALVVSAALLLHYRLKIGFVSDDWSFIGERSLGGIDSLLEPHNENIVVLQAALYRVFYVLFGVESAVPLQVFSLLVFLFSVVLFFVWVRERVGEWIATFMSIPLLFMGTAYQDLLWAFQVGYLIAMAAGLIALLALEREGRYGRPIACAALAGALMTSSLGLPFLAGAAVMLLFRDGWKGLFSYVLLVPAGLFLVWYLGWGNDASSFLSVSNFLDAPRFLAESLQSVVKGLTGLHRLSDPAGDLLGWALTVLLVGYTGYSLIRRRTLPRAFLVALAVGLSFWILTAANQVPGMITRDPDQSRYQLPGAVFLLMILAGAFDGYRLGRKGLAALAAMSGISVVCSLGTLAEGSRILQDISYPPKASMTALDLAGDRAVPTYDVRLIPHFPIFIEQERFRRIEARYGRAGWTAEQVIDQRAEIRDQVDVELVVALGLTVAPGRPSAAGSCRMVTVGPGGDTFEAGPGRVTFAPKDSKLAVSVTRFGDAPVPIGGVDVGASGELVIPPDESQLAWRIHLTGGGQIRVCAQPLAE